MEKVENVILGIDLGQAKDFTAIAGIEKRQDYEPFTSVQKGDPFYLVKFLERPPLGTSYPDIIRRVTQLNENIEKKYESKPVLVVDSTGVGKPVFDQFDESGLRVTGVCIHGGNSVTRDGSIYNVPKRDLAGILQILYQTGRIKVSGALAEAKTLNKELLNFKVKISAEGHDSYEAWRESIHDDLVLAVAIGCWFGEKGIRKLKACRSPY